MKRLRFSVTNGAIRPRLMGANYFLWFRLCHVRVNKLRFSVTLLSDPLGQD